MRWLDPVVILCWFSWAASSQPSQNGTITSSTLILPPSNLTKPIPPLPPDFHVDVTFANNIPLTPLSLYAATTWLMYAFSIQQWTEPVDLSQVTPLAYADIYIDTLAFRSGVLTAGHCVLALHKLITTVYGPPSRYDYVVAAITLRGSHIGQLIIDNTDEPRINQNTYKNDTVIQDQQPTLRNASLTSGDSGTIADPNYNLLRVSYQYDGKSIRSEEIFTAALDGLTTLAPYSERSNECGTTTGVSGSGKVDFHVRSINLGVRITSCLVLKRALMLVSLYIMIPANRFGELDFTVKYAGVEVATGYTYVSRVPRVGRDNGTADVSIS